MQGALFCRHWFGRFPVEGEVDLLVEGVVPALVDVVQDAERREENHTTEHVGDHPPGPSSLHRIGSGVVSVFGERGVLVGFAAEIRSARCEHIHAAVDDDCGVGRGCEECDRLMISVHPCAGAG